MIFRTVLVTGTQRDKFESDLAACVQHWQTDGHRVEIQFAGKQSGVWNALVTVYKWDQ